MGFSRRATALLASLALLPALTAVQVATAPPEASATRSTRPWRGSWPLPVAPTP